MSSESKKKSNLNPHIEDCGPVLIVEDDAAFVRITSRRLESKGYKVLVARDGREGLAMAREHIPDVILSDWMMPHMNGLAMVAEIRKQPELEGIYIIMLSNKSDVRNRIEGFEEGVDDYLLKTGDTSELMARIGAGMRIRRLQKELMRRAQIDGMTELYNRTCFFTKIEEELRRAERYEHTTTLCMVDLNEFKSINDTLGHLAGDAAITHVARVMRELCRDSDIVARYGGDEFAILFVESDKEGAQQVMARIEALLREQPLVVEGREIPIQLSYGLAEANPHAIPDPDSLVAQADELLYQMKKAKKPASSPV